ncbi:FG-GAP-like repeat-containing protein [Chitinophaga sancti]|uniref:FG-GAP repeat domain-containing protein n=1 Tax=Chitinophaga sancti TaxID=1004 RepID=UPI003F7AD18C
MLRYIPFVFLVIIFSCKSRSRGEVLAEKNCSSCHLAVSPSLLDKETWLKHVLPAMAPKLGIGVWDDNQYYSGKGGISITEWNEIVKYYKELAPDSLQSVTHVLKEDASLFVVRTPVEVDDTIYRATTTMVSIDPFTGRVYSSAENGKTAALFKWEGAQLQQVIDLQSTGVDLTWIAPDTGILTCIGNLRAVDQLSGVIWKVTPLSPEEERVRTIAMGLPRPVQTLPFGKDYICLGFGHKSGGLYLLNEETRKTIRDVPGAIHAETGDFNNDGYPDMMALFAYDDEGIWLFLNDKKGGFSSEQVLRFPPVYGSTSFQLADLNKDGKLDIIYTAGDNGDYSMVLKPYHGVYVFLNKGNFKFNVDKPDFFYPVNGCTKVIAADFDQDGDLDLATIAFFADLKNNPAEKFIYFEQKKFLLFEPHAVANLAAQGRWICMAAGDYDKDGDIDLVLGSYSRGFIIQEGYEPAWNIHMPMVLLENKKK